MAMVGDDRAQVQYDIIAGGPNFSKLSDEEKADLLSKLQAIWGGDTTYIQDNADVLPTAHSGEGLEASIGIAVATAGGPTAQTGATTALGPIEGKGKVA